MILELPLDIHLVYAGDITALCGKTTVEINRTSDADLANCPQCLTAAGEANVGYPEDPDLEDEKAMYRMIREGAEMDARAERMVA